MGSRISFAENDFIYQKFAAWNKMENKYMEEAEQVLLHTYNRFRIVLDKGEGVYLYDVNGKKYLDFAAGIAVFALGYHNEKYNNALKHQIDKVIQDVYKRQNRSKADIDSA